MIRHLFTISLRKMAANRLLSAISILGLSVGIATAILMGLVIRNQMSFDHFIPGYERTYRLFYPTKKSAPCALSGGHCDIPPRIIPGLLQGLPEIETIAQIDKADPVEIQQGNVTGGESFYWADPNFFEALPLPVLDGTLDGALSRPDDIVLTGAMAHKYFGRDDVVGRTLKVAGYPMTIRAVIRDLPANATNLESSIFISRLGAPKSAPPTPGQLLETSTRPGLKPSMGDTETYLRLKPGTSLSAAQVTEVMWSEPFGKNMETMRKRDPDFNGDAVLLPLDRVNLWEKFHPGTVLRLTVTGMAGMLVLLIAAMNFVNLMVARALRRETEVGVRKVCGGGRGDLMLQFLGEAAIAVGLAAAIAIALTECLLPPINAFLRTGATLNWGDPLLLVVLLGGGALLALAIGAWPAFILSGFSPTSVLRGWTARAGRADLVRGALVTLQFAILIALGIVASLVWLQRDFATRDALRVNGDQMLLIRLGASHNSNLDLFQQNSDCPQAFMNQIRNLPGVRGAACSSAGILTGRTLPYLNKTGALEEVGFVPADPRLFALYGIKPVAGVLPQARTASGPNGPSGTVINETAARKFGFASPQAALGKNWLVSTGMPPDMLAVYSHIYGAKASIVAVVPDFSFTPVNQPIPASVFAPFDVPREDAPVVHVKLDERNIPETLAGIDHIWGAANMKGPLDRFFLDDYMQQLYQDMTRDAQFFAGCTVLAIMLACLGLVGVAVATAERRTKEIGIRKAMGAINADIVLLLLWQFSQPVLWANVIAWPVAWWLMRRWLSGFAYHIDLHWWVFAVASAAALLIAMLTVMGQALLVARQKPVLALRYE